MSDNRISKSVTSFNSFELPQWIRKVHFKNVRASANRIEELFHVDITYEIHNLTVNVIFIFRQRASVSLQNSNSDLNVH